MFYSFHILLYSKNLLALSQAVAWSAARTRSCLCANASTSIVLMKTIIPFKNPEHDDIVVFKFPLDPEKDFIKRVVGVEGDVVECHDKKVYVNGKLQNHDFVRHKDSNIIPGILSKRDNFGPVTIPSDSIFVMGDNRDNSYDGRFWGFVNLKAVKGKAFIIYWSWDKENFGVRWGRIGDILR